MTNRNRNIGQMRENSWPVAELSANSGNPVPVHVDFDLPKSEKKVAKCREHLPTVGPELQSAMMMACEMPAEGEEQMVRLVFLCDGPTMFKKCRLRLLQATREGDIITETGVELH